MKMGISPYRIVLLQLIPLIYAHGYDTSDFDGWYQPIPHRPVDIVTDVINDLGVRILQQYTAHGNVAFSPTGVAFVLAALYEGSSGRGSQQIASALGLPRDRDITRIGFRDIHRRLRTYLNADGFLGGLTLNQENTRLRPEYEDVLRFYGFDLLIVDEETNVTTTPVITTTTAQPTNEAETTLVADDTTTPIVSTKLIDPQETTSVTDVPTSSPTSITSSIELLETTLNTANVRDRLTQTTTTGSPTILMDMITKVTTPSFETTVKDRTSSEELPSTVSSRTSMKPETFETTDATNSFDETTRMSETDVSRLTTSTTLNGNRDNVNGRIDTTLVNDTVSSISTSNPIDSTSVVSNSDALTSSVTEESFPSTISVGQTTSAATTTETSTMDSKEIELTATMKSTMNIMEKMMTITEDTTTIVSTDMPMNEINVITESMSTSIENSTDVNEMIDRTTNGPPVDLDTVSTDLPSNETVSTTSTMEIESTVLMDTTTMDAEITTIANEESATLSPTTKDDSTNRVRKRNVRSLRGYFSSYPDEGIWMQDLGIWKPYSPSVSEASVRDSTEIPFLVNGCDVSSVSAARYIAVLPFAYFPSLHAVALEFPLDDPRYNILLLMSTDRRDTYRLTRDLSGKSLRLLRNQLQPTWVRATIPSFMLRGFVTLTSFLQRLGIVDVFEPRAADLSPMTPDLGVYARDVQQSIGVNIRNYMQPDRTHSRNGLFERAGPVPFTAVHPFLFFIVDAETSVALIAGRINDPLNSRIL